MVDLTQNLQEGDRFRFIQITVEARKITDKGIIRGSGSHRAKRIIANRGHIYVNKSWRVSTK